MTLPWFGCTCVTIPIMWYVQHTLARWYLMSQTIKCSTHNIPAPHWDSIYNQMQRCVTLDSLQWLYCLFYVACSFLLNRICYVFRYMIWNWMWKPNLHQYNKQRQQQTENEVHFSWNATKLGLNIGFSHAVEIMHWNLWHWLRSSVFGWTWTQKQPNKQWNNRKTYSVESK